MVHINTEGRNRTTKEQSLKDQPKRPGIGNDRFHVPLTKPRHPPRRVTFSHEHRELDVWSIIQAPSEFNDVAASTRWLFWHRTDI
jgi:hypothetical protein